MPRAPRQTSAAQQTRPQPVHLGYGRDNCTDAFLQQFADAQSQKRRSRDQLTTQQHATFRENADLVAFMPPAWADNTKFNVTGILKKWKAYCERMKLGGWQGVLQAAQKGTAMSFLVHLCETCNIKSSGTCWQYFRQWKQLYAKMTGRRFDINESDEVLKFHKTHLIPRFRLEQPALRDKNVADSGDLLALLSFNLAYDHRIFPGERQRLDVEACYLILASTGCRPAEIVDGEKKIPQNGCWDELFGCQAALPLKPPQDDTPPDAHSREITQLLELEAVHCGCPKALCYEDIQLMFVRHPEMGLDTLAMEVSK